MSFCHIKLKKIANEKNNIVKYEILSPDFNDKQQWENFGTIEIDLLANSFKHTNDNLWKKNKIYPIDIFGLRLEERKIIFEKNYKDFGCGRWSMNVYNFIEKSIELNEFPEEKSLIS